MELRKFPVTAPDGTEYRVKIEEEPANVFESASAKVTVYTKRKQIDSASLEERGTLTGIVRTLQNVRTTLRSLLLR